MTLNPYSFGVKRLATACVLLASAFPAATATAEDVYGELGPRPYISTSIGYSFVDASIAAPLRIAEEFSVFTLSAGLRLNDYIGVELGHLRSTREDFNYTIPGSQADGGIAASTKLQFYGYYADLIGYLPLSYLTKEESNIELLGLIGISEMKLKLKARFELPNTQVVEPNLQDTDKALRYGLGVQYHMSDSLSAKAMYRYIDVDFNGAVDGGQIIDLGINYTF